MRNLILLAVLSATSPPLLASTESPNVILVMVDDMGYGDPSCFNSKTLARTPEIDAMAAGGMRFTRFYAAAPVCSPTRGSCLTGRHPYRYGIYSANTGHLPREEVTISELLKNRGYTTGHFGKWHVGTLTTTVRDSNRGGPQSKAHFSPPRWHGFDDSFVTEAKVPTFDPLLKPAQAGRIGWDALEDQSSGEAYGTRYWSHAGQEVTKNLSGDDSKIIMDRATAFIEQAVADDSLFFTSIWLHAPHLPVVASVQDREPWKDLTPHQRNYFGCIAALDRQVGRLRRLLRARGVERQTIIFFCSDNGPEGNEKSPGSAGGLRGRKRSLYEGGVRVPGIVEWPGHIEAGSTTDVAAVTSDYLPTILDLTQTPIPKERPLDGVSLQSLLLGKPFTRLKPIGFQSAKQVAWHEGNLKLISQNQGRTWELYDLNADPAETKDLATTRPEEVRRLAAECKQWQTSCRNSDSGNDYRE